MDEFVIKLIAYTKIDRTEIRFRDGYSQETYDKYLQGFKNDAAVYKILMIKDDVEEVLFEKIN